MPRWSIDLLVDEMIRREMRRLDAMCIGAAHLSIQAQSAPRVQVTTEKGERDQRPRLTHAIRLPRPRVCR